MKQFVEALLKSLAVNLIEFDYLPRSSLLQTEEVVILVEEQRYAQHRNPVVDCLLNSVGSTVGYEDSNLPVAQEVFLWHPLHDHGVVAQCGWTVPDVPPNHLTTDSILVANTVKHSIVGVPNPIRREPLSSRCSILLVRQMLSPWATNCCHQSNEFQVKPHVYPIGWKNLLDRGASDLVIHHKIPELIAAQCLLTSFTC